MRFFAPGILMNIPEFLFYLLRRFIDRQDQIKDQPVKQIKCNANKNYIGHNKNEDSKKVEKIVLNPLSFL